MKTRTTVKAGGVGLNHNEKMQGMKVRSTIKSGGLNLNHNEKLSA